MVKTTTKKPQNNEEKMLQYCYNIVTIAFCFQLRALLCFNYLCLKMQKNKRIWIGLSIAITFLILLSQSCKKSKIDSPWSTPTITTSEISNITETTATAGADIVSNGGNAVTESGVCWSTNENPTIEDNLTKEEADSGVFLSSISGLISNTKYYVRAYATNGEGTGYGNSVSFTTNGVPTLTTNEVTSITPTTAIGGGNVTNDGGSAVTARGICLATTENPTLADIKTVNGAGLGAFTSDITGLADGAVYYVRAYATNSSGTSYGNSVSFSTQAATLPVLTTASISNTTQTTANCGGDITSSGGATVTARGVCWSLSTNPTISDDLTSDGNGIGSFNSSITGLSSGKFYYVRAYATNKVGTSYGDNELCVTLDATEPILTTTSITTITNTTAISGGSISSDGGSTIIERGVCWAPYLNPITFNSKTSNGAGTGVFTSNLTGLTGGVTYFVRAYATNAVGTSYGANLTFKTPFVIGQSYAGGIIAYILQSGDPGYDANVQHGLIAAANDATVTIRWYNGTYVTTYATGTALGTGFSNTYNIIWNQGATSTTYAAGLAEAYNAGTYTDWYLPSKDELNKLYINRFAIGGFMQSNYWTSTELSSNYIAAWAQNFQSGNQGTLDKVYGCRIRAVRTF